MSEQTATEPVTEDPPTEPETTITVVMANGDHVTVRAEVDTYSGSVILAPLDIAEGMMIQGHAADLKLTRTGYPARIEVDPASAVAAIVNYR